MRYRSRQGLAAKAVRRLLRDSRLHLEWKRSLLGWQGDMAQFAVVPKGWPIPRTARDHGRKVEKRGQDREVLNANLQELEGSRTAANLYFQETCC